MLSGPRRHIVRALRASARLVERPRETWASVRSGPGVSAEVTPVSPEVRHVSVPLDAPRRPRMRADLEPDRVDLVMTVDAEDLDRRPEAVAELARTAIATGMRVHAVVYEAEESVGKTHAPPRLPDGLPLVEPFVARGWSTGLAWTYGAIRGARVVVVDSSADVGPESLRRLADEVGGDVALAQAVLRNPNETVASAGAVLGPPFVAPGALFGGFPSEDVEALGVIEVAAADTPVFAVATDLLSSVPPSADIRLSVTGLSFAVTAADAERHRVVSVALGRSYQTRPLARRSDVAAQDLLATWSDHDDVASDAALSRAGFRLKEVGTMPTGVIPARVGRPVVVRSVPPIRTEVDEPAPRLRWAVKTAAWAGRRGDDWGDVFFARDLAAGLRRLGQDVVIDNRESSVRPESDQLDDVCLVLRGLDRVPLNPHALNVLWVISHPDLVTRRELAGFDLRFAAGGAWADRTTRTTGLRVDRLLQATDPARFHPGAADDDLRSDVLFVGKTREVFRPIVRDALEADLDLSVWGEGWDRFLPAGRVRGVFLDNDDLPRAYRSARIVLNDHWADMAREGFISNRVFDAVASGATVVSDVVDGLDEVFGDAVQTYSSVADLRHLDARIGADGSGARLAAADAVARDHSFESRASVLLSAVVDERRRRGV